MLLCDWWFQIAAFRRQTTSIFVAINDNSLDPDQSNPDPGPDALLIHLIAGEMVGKLSLHENWLYACVHSSL